MRAYDVQWKGGKCDPTGSRWQPQTQGLQASRGSGSHQSVLTNWKLCKNYMKCCENTKKYMKLWEIGILSIAVKVWLQQRRTWCCERQTNFYARTTKQVVIGIQCLIMSKWNWIIKSTIGLFLVWTWAGIKAVPLLPRTIAMGWVGWWLVMLEIS